MGTLPCGHHFCQTCADTYAMYMQAELRSLQSDVSYLMHERRRGGSADRRISELEQTVRELRQAVHGGGKGASASPQRRQPPLLDNASAMPSAAAAGPVFAGLLGDLGSSRGGGGGDSYDDAPSSSSQQPSFSPSVLLDTLLSAAAADAMADDDDGGSGGVPAATSPASALLEELRRGGGDQAAPVVVAPPPPHPAAAVGAPAAPAAPPAAAVYPAAQGLTTVAAAASAAATTPLFKAGGAAAATDEQQPQQQQLPPNPQVVAPPSEAGGCAAAAAGPVAAAAHTPGSPAAPGKQQPSPTRGASAAAASAGAAPTSLPPPQQQQPQQLSPSETASSFSPNTSSTGGLPPTASPAPSSAAAAAAAAAPVPLPALHPPPHTAAPAASPQQQQPPPLRPLLGTEPPPTTTPALASPPPPPTTTAAPSPPGSLQEAMQVAYARVQEGAMFQILKLVKSSGERFGFTTADAGAAAPAGVKRVTSVEHGGIGWRSGVRKGLEILAAHSEVEAGGSSTTTCLFVKLEDSITGVTGWYEVARNIKDNEGLVHLDARICVKDAGGGGVEFDKALVGREDARDVPDKARVECAVWCHVKRAKSRIYVNARDLEVLDTPPPQGGIVEQTVTLVARRGEGWGFKVDDRRVVMEVTVGETAHRAGVREGMAVLSRSETREGERTKLVLRVGVDARRERIVGRVGDTFSQAKQGGTVELKDTTLHGTPLGVAIINFPDVTEKHGLRSIRRGHILSRGDPIDFAFNIAYNKKENKDVLYVIDAVKL
eukprot:Rhum_TRINITY_DN14327_c3_g3::Rhum_TRINITY_DN14327_c3_g3_i1::g.80486::m.80486